MSNIKLIIKCFFLLLVTVFICADANADVFTTIQGRAFTFATSLRTLAYAISCFGIVMFTFLAITGKINFKHLGFIFISLFMLSATGAIIDYFSGNAGGAYLEYHFNDTYTAAVCSSSICK